MRNNYLNVLVISSTGIIGGLISYCYHPLMLQYLSIQQFGVFGSLVSIFNILWILVTGISFFLLQQVAHHIEDKPKVKQLFRWSTRVLLWWWLGVFFLYLITSPFIALFLHINIWLIIIVGSIILFSFGGAGVTATLTWLKKFPFLWFTQIFTPTIKLCIGFLFVYLGYSLYGAVWWLVVSAFLGFLISLWYGARYLKSYTSSGTNKELVSDFQKNKKAILHFFLVNIFFAFLMNWDMLLARNLLDPHMAWIYAGISIIGKFLIFALLSVETVYYGQIMEKVRSKLPSRLILYPLLIILIGGGVALVANYFLWWLILGTLKTELTGYTGPYLLILVYYIVLAVVSFLSKLLVGRWKYQVNYALLFTCILMTWVVYIFWTTDIFTFVVSLLISLGIGWLGIAWLFMKEFLLSPGSKSF